MKDYENYDFANLNENQIAMINNTQQALEQNSDEKIVLIAYKKTI